MNGLKQSQSFLPVVKNKIARFPIIQTILYWRSLRRPYLHINRIRLSHAAHRHHCLYDPQIQKRIDDKKRKGDPLHVVFVLHEPKFYGSVASTINFLREDSRFKVTLMAAPCRGATSESGEYHEGGVKAFLEKLGLPYVDAVKADGSFCDLRALEPDFIFFQQPYVDVLFKGIFDIREIATYAFLAYIPYDGINTSHRLRYVVTWQPFFSFAHFAFLATANARNELTTLVPNVDKTINAYSIGCPKFENLVRGVPNEESAWRMIDSETNVFRVLWAPRWTPDESHHFIALWHPLLNWAQSHPKTVEFVFRPHPAMFAEYLKQGFMTRQELDELKSAFDQSPNTHIDDLPFFERTYSMTDLVISEPGTSMCILFVPYNRPIICTVGKKTNKDVTKYIQDIMKGLYCSSSVENTVKLVEKLRNGWRDDEKAKLHVRFANDLLAPLREKPFAEHVRDAFLHDAPPCAGSVVQRKGDGPC